MKQKKYLINGFGIHFKNLEKHLEYLMTDFFPTSRRFDVITNFCKFFIFSISGRFDKYSIIHISTWENFLNFWNRKGKIIIGESHGFHFGLNFSDTLQHFHGIKKIFAYIINIFVQPLIEYRIKKFDIYYVSTPNMLEHVKKIRPDARWLPNAIDFELFSSYGDTVEMKGDPVIFYPTRIHSFKNPTFGIELFLKIKKKYPKAVLHCINYPNGGDALYTKYRKELANSNDYVWHEFKTKKELSDMYRSSDIVLGHFHPSLGMMSLVELQAAACETAVISYDKYEIQTHLEDLEKITFEILEDPKMYKEFVSKNRQVVLKNHSAENIAKTLEKDISRVENKIHIKKATKYNIKKHFHDIEKIEQEYFSDIGVWNLENFTKEFYNKFECSYLLFQGSKVIGYIIGHSIESYGYVNRVAMSSEFSGQGLGNYLITCFNDNLKYTLGVRVGELVTHDGLNVDAFYLREGFHQYTAENDIREFLERKGKADAQNEYIGENKFMKIFYKSL